jgi:peptidoglycan/xylan/chitin deacetylase (PgdA/CDA1 family)
VSTEGERAAFSPITWDEVEVLARSELIDFESHGVSHAALAGLDAAELEFELAASRAAISQRTGKRCRHFCYPFGGDESIGRIAPSVVARYYDSAATMNRGRLTEGNPYRLPRIPLYCGDTPGLAQLKVVTA